MWWIPALAAPCPKPTSDSTLRVLVAEARDAIDAADLRAHAAARLRVRQAVECLRGPLPPGPWADFLVTEAIVKHHADQSDWSVPLTTALTLVPDHQGVPDFLRQAPRAPSLWGNPPPALPPDAIVVLDGRPHIGSLPNLSGTHVLQVPSAGAWITHWVDNGFISPRWVAALAAPPTPHCSTPTDGKRKRR